MDQSLRSPPATYLYHLLRVVSVEIVGDEDGPWSSHVQVFDASEKTLALQDPSHEAQVLQVRTARRSLHRSG